MATKAQKVEDSNTITVGGYVLTSATITSLILYFSPDMDVNTIAVITPFIMAGVNLLLVIGKKYLKQKGLL